MSDPRERIVAAMAGLKQFYGQESYRLMVDLLGGIEDAYKEDLLDAKGDALAEKQGAGKQVRALRRELLRQDVMRCIPKI